MKKITIDNVEYEVDMDKAIKEGFIKEVPKVKGYFDKNGRVRAVKLRCERSGNEQLINSQYSNSLKRKSSMEKITFM